MANTITLLKVDVSVAPKGYKVVEVAYKSSDGTTKGMKLVGFAQTELTEYASKLKAGDVVDVEFEKNDKGFWCFKSIVKKAEGTSQALPTQPAAKSGGNWETTEERARRQVMIVRQSSISSAVANFAANGGRVGAGAGTEIINLAKEFEAYVLNKLEESGEIQ